MGFFVYILRCRDGSYYTGHTDDLDYRLGQHQRGEIPGFTHKRRPVSLVFSDEFNTRQDAFERERQIKGWSRAKKEALMKQNWDRLSKISRASKGDVSAARSAHPSRGSGFAGAEDPSTGSGRTDATDTPAVRPPLEFANARDLPPEQAAFFHLGPSQQVAGGVIFVSAMGNVSAFVCGDRLLLVDTAVGQFTPRVLDDLRKNYAQAPVEALVYTHGHIDHVTGAETIIGEAKGRGDQRPRVIAHRDVAPRFDRYRLLAAQNDHINRIQFNMASDAKPFSNATFTYPDTTYDRGLEMKVGGELFELHHARGETDDETWVWCPGRRVLCTGDTFVWSSPNAGNPYKVQRYARDWADALETMASLKPAHLLPGHGPVLSGEERIEDALLSTAHFLRSIHDHVVTLMNQGKWLEDIIREITLPPTDKPWLQPVYDHPQFIARNVYRLYGGWYDGDPANILPAHSEEIATALVSATGAGPILDRARKAQAGGDLQMACHLVDFVRKGEPENREAWELWRDLFAERAATESSLMARGAFLSAVREAEERLK